jgi:hypothetical protein
MGVIIVKFTHAIARVLKQIKVWAGGGRLLERTLLALLLPLFLLLGAGLLLCCVEAAATVGRLARALEYLSFCDLIPAAANWSSMRRNQM